MKNYWLVKSDPETYDWDDFVALGRDHWDGVRNYQARNFMKNMKLRDQVLFYHSGSDRSIIGLAEVVREYYPDPTTNDDRWVVVDLVPIRKLKNMVSLKTIKTQNALNGLYLVKNARLSVMPVKKEEFDIIISLEKHDQ